MKDKAKKRKDYEAHKDLIRDAYLQILKEKKGKRPTTVEIAEKTGLHKNSVLKHVKSLDFSKLSEDRAMWKILTDDVILSIYRSAVHKLNPQAQKLWLQVMENFQERTETQHSGKIKMDQHITVGNESAAPIITISKEGGLAITGYRLKDKVLRIEE